jgi:hypothetical protein
MHLAFPLSFLRGNEDGRTDARTLGSQMVELVNNYVCPSLDYHNAVHWKLRFLLFVLCTSITEATWQWL